MTAEELKEIMAKPITATGTVEITAAKGADGNEDSNANKRMTITAYNGGLMSVGWDRPVGIELSGVSWRGDNAVPILCLHNTYSIDAICGQAKLIEVRGNSLVVEADFMPVSDQAKKIHELAKAGYKFQASVGVTSTDTLVVAEGEKATLNGAEVEGPC